MVAKQARDVHAELLKPVPPSPLSAEEPVRLGLVGVGRWGKNLLRVLSSTPGAELTGVAEPRPLSPLPVPCAPQLDELLAQPSIVGLVIATPSALHAAHANQALVAGRHVFVEKPLAHSAAAAHALCELAAARGLCLMVGHILRYHPAIDELKRRIATLGRPKRLDLVRLAGRASSEDPWWCLAPHDLSLIEHLLESPIASVACSEANGRVVTQALSHSGVPARVEVGFGAVKQSHVEVECEAGSARFDASGALQIAQPGQAPRTVPSSGAEPLGIEMAHFIRCIQTGSEPLTNGLEGLRVVSALEAGDRSRRSSGRWQDVVRWPS
ncbi:MAG: Gfo/Idh/MocA family oxidoreductase [Polyangiaceae bacterium]|nr:Gfo/Idh/MocA family oxidoreductase [Polyangiaceae bacterium]MCW5791046.1 Gfo/Idh/MocA family oxidoreductase [Polyangiaceae bacterium]